MSGLTIERLRELSEKITQGEWDCEKYATHVGKTGGSGICRFASIHGMYNNYENNAKAIALLPDLLRFAIAKSEEVKRLEKEAAEKDQQIEYHKSNAESLRVACQSEATQLKQLRSDAAGWIEKAFKNGVFQGANNAGDIPAQDLWEDSTAKARADKLKGE